MCWGSFAVPPPAGVYAGKNAAGTPDSQQHSSTTPDNYLDESLLGHVTDDAIFGDLLDGELDMLDCLLKEEDTAGNEEKTENPLKRPAEAISNANKQLIVADADKKPVPLAFCQNQPQSATRAAEASFSYEPKNQDYASDASVQTPDDARVAYTASMSKDVPATEQTTAGAQLQGTQGASIASTAAQAQVAAAQQMAAAAAAQLQMQMGMMPNMAAMQMLAANQGMMCSGFPFTNQMMAPSFGLKMAGAAAKPMSEQEEAVERIKKKRRESAQRSRARKNQYMRALEVENKGLRSENAKLREYLMGYELQFGLKMPNIPCTPVAVRPAPEPAMHDD